MNQRIYAVLLEVLEKMYNHFGEKHDVHYREGGGALFVPYGQPLLPDNIMARVSEQQIIMMSITGVNISFQ